VGMTDAIDLTKEQRTTLTALLRRFLPGVAVWAYGSRVKWTARPNSDLDLVAFATPAQRPQVAELKDALAESNLPFPVDLHVWDEVPERFREIIRKEYVVVQEAKEPERKTSMPGEWPEVTTFANLIEEGALEIGDGYRAKNEELGGDGLIFLRAGHVTDSHINFTGVERFHAALEARVRSKLSMPGDAVVTTKGNSTGRTTFVTSSMPPFVYSPHLSYWRSKDRNRIEGGFLRYWSKGSEFSEQLSGMKASTDMAPYLSLIDQKRLRISLPPIKEQRAIAHILGTLDDKIELNRRMNETLEAMARAFFKSWFVDFDPVRAKAAGRAPGLPKSIADLFPDCFEDSELGEIPRGWGIMQLDDLADIQGGKQLPTEEGKPLGQFPVFGANGIMGYAERSTHDGFVIAFGRVGAYCGSVHWTYDGAWINNNASSVVPRCWPEFVLQAMLMANFERMRTGSAQPFIPNSSLVSLQVVRAPDKVLDEFCSVVKALRLREQASKSESHLLAALRDTLLPKLISGELRVPAWQDLAELASGVGQKVAT